MDSKTPITTQQLILAAELNAFSSTISWIHKMKPDGALGFKWTPEELQELHKAATALANAAQDYANRVLEEMA